MTDERVGDPPPDSLPEDELEANPDSPPAAQNDEALGDVEQLTGARSVATDDGAVAEPHDASARFSGPDGVDDKAIDPRVN
jgi:hypothetical protein